MRTSIKTSVLVLGVTAVVLMATGCSAQTTTTTTATTESGGTQQTTTTQTTTAPQATPSQENALRKAKTYLQTMPYSHDGLIKQLEFEGFSTDDATYGADNCGADWNEQAAKKAKSYNDMMGYSHDGLVGQLEYDGFTHEQAEYGASSLGL
jgi:hypothetical protein